MIAKKILMSMALVGILALTSCTDEDTVAPVIELSQPSNGDIFSVADGFEMIGRVSDNEALTSISVTSDLGLDWSNSTFDDPKDFPFNLNIELLPSTPIGDYIITVTATDFSGNVATETRAIEIQ